MSRLRRLLQLGDIIESALSKVGITSDRVSKWLGHPCKCRERRKRLNAIGDWAFKVLGGKIPPAEAEQILTKVVGVGDEQLPCQDGRSGG